MKLKLKTRPLGDATIPGHISVPDITHGIRPIDAGLRSGLVDYLKAWAGCVHCHRPVVFGQTEDRLDRYAIVIALRCPLCQTAAQFGLGSVLNLVRQAPHHVYKELHRTIRDWLRKSNWLLWPERGYDIPTIRLHPEDQQIFLNNSSSYDEYKTLQDSGYSIIKVNGIPTICDTSQPRMSYAHGDPRRTMLIIYDQIIKGPCAYCGKAIWSGDCSCSPHTVVPTGAAEALRYLFSYSYVRARRAP